MFCDSGEESLASEGLPGLGWVRGAPGPVVGGGLRSRAALRGLVPSACGQRGGIHQDDPLLGVVMRTSVPVGWERVCRFS